MLYLGSQERRNDTAVGTEFCPRMQVGETHYRLVGTSHDDKYPGGPTPRAHRPTNVYIYPVHLKETSTLSPWQAAEDGEAYSFPLGVPDWTLLSWP